MKRYFFLLIPVFIIAISCTSLCEAAVGDCLSWVWGGRNQETTYSAPYPSTVALTNGGFVSPSPVAVQTTVLPTTVAAHPYSVQPYIAASPVKTGVAEPVVTQTTVLQPTISKEWTYSRIKSVDYKPVQLVDPYTGIISTVYRTEESQSLLPWLHQKEVVRYEPVTVTSPTPTVTVPISNPNIVRANYAGSVAGPIVEPIAQTSYSTPVYNAPIVYSYIPCIPYDPCAGGVQMIPSSVVEGTAGEMIRSSTSSSTFIAPYGTTNSRGSGSVPNYGTPDMVIQLENSRPSNTVPVYTTPAITSETANTVPVVNPSTNSHTPHDPYNPNNPIQYERSQEQVFRPTVEGTFLSGGVVSSNTTGITGPLVVPNTQMISTESAQQNDVDDPLAVSVKKPENRSEPLPPPIPAVGLGVTQPEEQVTRPETDVSNATVRPLGPRTLPYSPTSKMVPKKLQSPTRFELYSDPVDNK